MSKKKWLDMTDVFTPAGLDAIHTGQLLVFDKLGQKVRYKIKRIARGKVWAVEVNSFTPEELEIHRDCNVDLLADPPFCQTHERPIGAKW